MYTTSQVKAAPAVQSSIAKPATQPLSAPSLETVEASSLTEQLEHASRLGHHFAAISVLLPDPPVQPKRAGGSGQPLPVFNAPSQSRPNPIPVIPAGWAVQPRVQAKLTVGQPNDHYEQEADHLADKVMRRVEPLVQAKCACGGEAGPEGECAACTVQRLAAQSQVQTKSNEEDIVQTKSDTLPTEATSALESRLNSSRGIGAALPDETRSSMESAFGVDFSGVRVHTDGEAVQMNRQLSAHAFTHGSDIYFNVGKYNPGGQEGMGLLAHELTHVVQQTGVDNPIRRDIKKEENADQAIEKLLEAGSFDTKWKNFVSHTDSIMRSIFVEMPAYYDLSSGGTSPDPLHAFHKQQSLALVNDLILHFEQSDVDAYTYGMDFARRLDFIGEKGKAIYARKLYQKGWQFMSYLRKTEDTDIAVNYIRSDPSFTIGNVPLPKGSQPETTSKTVPTSVADKQLDSEPVEPEMTPAKHQYIENAAENPLPYEGDLIVKLPRQTYLMAAKGKPYLIEGSIGKAVTNGKVVNGYNNFVIIQDLKSLDNKIEKYYVSPLVSKGAVYNGDAQYSSTDFSTYIERESGKTPVIPAIFNRLNNKRNLQIIAIMLQDTDITPREISGYFNQKQIVSAIKNEFTASPELTKEAFAQVDKLIGDGEKQEASDKLATLNEAAFALLPFNKKLEYLELLTDVWTWQSQEKAIVEIFKSVDSIGDLDKIKNHLKSKKIWEKMFADLNHEYWSLLVAVGMKFSSTPYTLAEFKTLLWEYVRNVSVVGVFVNSNGEPEVIPQALIEIEQAIRAGVDFLEGIWDSIIMFVTHPDKIIEGVAQMMNLILNLQLVQLGYPPAIEYVAKVFGQISKQVVAAVRGLAIMGAEDIVIKKVKWAIIWEVASWFIGIGEIKAALKSVQITGITEKVMAVTRVFSRATGLGKLAIKEAELASRFERLVVIMMKESKVLKSEEEAMTLLSKLNSSELEKLVIALQKSEVPEGASLLQLAKETPELEGLAKKVESMQKLASADKKVAMTEKEIGNLQKLVAEESDPLFQKLLNKEEQLFNEKVRQSGNVLEVVEKEFKEAYDVEVKIGDHTYRRSIEDGTWCRFTKKLCKINLDNSAVNKQKPIHSGTEPVGAEPMSRGYAIEDKHLSNLGWDGLPDYFPGIDGVKGGIHSTPIRGGKQVKVIEHAEVLSIKSTRITDPETLISNLQNDYLKKIQRNTFSNGELFVKNAKSKNLHLVFEQGFIDKVENKEVFKALKEMKKISQQQGVNFEWFVIPTNGRIINGPEFFKAQKALLDAL